MKTFWLCFVPLFVAVDAIGLLPLFLGLTQPMPRDAVRRIIVQSVITAAVVALAFLLAGAALLAYLGVQVDDFMVAGGILIFAIALADMLRTESAPPAVDHETFGAVPLGVPLIAGPAVLTTSLLLANAYGPVPTAAALISNILIAGTAFLLAGHIHRFLGKAGSRTISKIANLLLAAIAVMMVRKGITAFITGIGG